MTTQPVHDDPQDDQLDRAIEELRGVLHEGQGAGGRGPADTVSPNSAVIMNIPVEVQIVLGSTELPVSELMALQQGSTVALNRRVGEPVDVVVNGRRIARGEITVLDNDPSRFGIRLTEIVTGPSS
jgi:flagellar motor switch protein FliN/FliY